MTDKLQEFIQNHRDAFDAALPDAHGWRGVERTLERLRTAGGVERFVLLNRVLLDTEPPPEAVWGNIERQLDRKNPPRDGLESFIAEHRTELDTATPDPRIWTALEKNIPLKSSAPGSLRVGWKRQLLRIAAAIALLITGIGLGIWYAGAGQNTAPAGMALREVSAEYAELEDFYQRDIAVKQQKLVSFSGEQGAVVQADLQQLDDMMRELQQELAHVPPGNREQVVRAMIENYKAKAAILERVLERVEGRDQPKTEINNKKADNETESI